MGEEAHSAQHFLTGQDLQSLAKQVRLALGDSVREEGFSMD